MTDIAATATTPTSSSNVPWIERYRPSNLNEISHQTEVVNALKTAVDTGHLPHLLFYGPPGSGKTSVALALCKSLWDPNSVSYKRRILELNASDERGISVVRDKIKHFASLSVGTSNASTANNKKKASSKNFFAAATKANRRDDDDDDNKKMNAMEIDKKEAVVGSSSNAKKYPNPPFKIIILDEADNITIDAQSALRRIIEAYSRVTRFVLICNYVTRIIEPLASRCAKFRFQSLPPQSMVARLEQICEQERMDNQHLEKIVSISNGDMRKAVTTLQCIHALGGGSHHDDGDDDTAMKDAAANDDNMDTVIEEMAGLPPTRVVEDLFSLILGGNQKKKSTDFDTMERHVTEHIICEGYSTQIILSGLMERIIAYEEEDDDETVLLTEADKARLCIRIAEVEKNMIEGADEYLQFMIVCSLFLELVNSHK